MSPTRTFTTWEALLKAYQNLQVSAELRNQRWLYRGIGDASFGLCPTLERQTTRFGKPVSTMRETEARLLREFKRHYHRYSPAPPDELDDMRWLALIQHHGGPTRLLDFTYSFYIAVFFAIRDATEKSSPTLWLLEHDGLWKLLLARLDEEAGAAVTEDPKSPETCKLLLGQDRSGVMPINPLNLDERLAVQQGVFVMSLDLTRPLATVVADYLEGGNEGLLENWRLELPMEELRHGLAECQRMNINEVSLFPGVDGLARNLKNMVGLPHLFVGDGSIRWRGDV